MLPFWLSLAPCQTFFSSSFRATTLLQKHKTALTITEPSSTQSNPSGVRFASLIRLIKDVQSVDYLWCDNTLALEKCAGFCQCFWPCEGWSSGPIPSLLSLFPAAAALLTLEPSRGAALNFSLLTSRSNLYCLLVSSASFEESWCQMFRLWRCRSV